MGDIRALTASERRFRDDPASDVEDWIAFLAEFANGATGTFEISRVAPGRGAGITEDIFIELYGTKGSIVFSLQDPWGLMAALGEDALDPARPLRHYEVPHAQLKIAGSPRDVMAHDRRWGYRYDQAFQFVESVKRGETRAPSFADGVRCQAVLDAALESARETTLGRGRLARSGMTRAYTCIIAAALLVGCGNEPPALTIAINAGVEGNALKAAAAEWGVRNRMRVDIVELPYANLFEKELLDLSSRTGAYDIIMMDDPWFPRLVENGQLAAARETAGRGFPGELSGRVPRSRIERAHSMRCLMWAIRSCSSIARICSTSMALRRRPRGTTCWQRRRRSAQRRKCTAT